MNSIKKIKNQSKEQAMMSNWMSQNPGQSEDVSIGHRRFLGLVGLLGDIPMGQAT